MSVLAYQFVAGLRTELQSKVAGTDGDFDALVVKARFEEAKAREIPRTQPVTRKQASPTPTTKVPSKPTDAANPGEEASTERARSSAFRFRGKCFNCGEIGLTAKFCKQKKRSGQEAVGQQVATVTASASAVETPHRQAAEERVANLRRELREAELHQALEEVAEVLHGIQTRGVETNTQLGARPEVQVKFAGCPVRALVDTGSPVTIVSLRFAIEALG